MRPIGFSTGALAKGDFKRALELIDGLGTNAIEFSALRFEELDPLLRFVTTHQFPGFEHVAFHAPSRFPQSQEADVTARLKELIPLKWPIVIHPDVMHSEELWQEFGRQLCIENMDERKPIGRTCAEMSEIFGRYPNASFCFDLGHAHQVDPSLSQAHCMIDRFRERLRQIHLSEVDIDSVHRPVGWIARTAFDSIVASVPENTAIILEAVVEGADVELELKSARELFGLHPASA